MASFSDLNLNKQLLNALTDLGFETPTPIQEKAFPIIMSGKDAIGIAQTGTGKTFSYLLPILRQLNFVEQRQPRVLIVVPTRELVVQVVSEIEKLAKYMTIRVGGVYGGGNINTQKRLVHAGLDIVVATPGRLMDLYLTRILQFNLIQKFVIDEVDEMLNLGFRTQLVNILDVLPKKRQNLMFSATLTEDVEKIIETHFSTPEYIEVISRGTPLAKIIQEGYNVPNFYTKVNLLESLLNRDDSMSKVLLFVKNKKIADEIQKELDKDFGEAIGVIHSNKSQPQRFNAIKQFDEGTHRVLIATDVVARGIDISDITHVVNFDISREASSYIHRIGRTGRADKAGIAVSFVIPTEVEYQKQIEALMGKKITMLDLPEDVFISDHLTQEEKPVTRDKTLKKIKRAPAPTGGFHEKSEKNKKTNSLGKRASENLRRIEVKRNKFKSSK